VNAWVKPADTAGARGILGSRGGDTFDMKLNGTELHGDIGSGSSWYTTSADVPFAYSPGNWYMITYVADTTGYTIYADGNLLDHENLSMASPLLANASNTARIGSDGPGVGEYFNGAIDDVRIYGRALSQADVQALYNLAE
jgi:hypothetical protein